MGRYGRRGLFARPNRSDRDAARAALDQVGMLPYADRQISNLSGGQQQRVFFARGARPGERPLLHGRAVRRGRRRHRARHPLPAPGAALARQNHPGGPPRPGQRAQVLRHAAPAEHARGRLRPHRDRVHPRAAAVRLWRQAHHPQRGGRRNVLPGGYVWKAKLGTRNAERGARNAEFGGGSLELGVGRGEVGIRDSGFKIRDSGFGIRDCESGIRTQSANSFSKLRTPISDLRFLLPPPPRLRAGGEDQRPDHHRRLDASGAVFHLSGRCAAGGAGGVAAAGLVLRAAGRVHGGAAVCLAWATRFRTRCCRGWRPGSCGAAPRIRWPSWWAPLWPDCSARRWCG